MYAKPLVLTLLMITSVLAGCLESSNVDDTGITDSTIDGLDTSADLIVIDDSEKVTPPPTGKETGCWVRLYTHVSGSTSIPVDTWYDPCPVELPRSTSLERGGCYVVTADEDKDGNIKYNTVRWLEPCPYWTISDDDREITQEDCERRNGTWVEALDRSSEPYCDFGENDRDDRDEDREITQEDCERRNGTWTEASDRPTEYYCDFGDRDSEDREDELRFRYSNITLHIYHGENLENSSANYTIKIMLNHSASPIHADNFRKHVMYGNYNNSTFHRIIDDFMIQGGDFQNDTGIGGYAADWYGICNGNRIANQSDCPNQEDWNIPDEADNGLEHNPCVISMAKTSQPHTGGSQFFLLPEDAQNPETGEQGTHWLDGIHTVFGEVTEGCEHITTLSQLETGEMDRPTVTVVIFSATVDN